MLFLLLGSRGVRDSSGQARISRSPREVKSIQKYRLREEGKTARRVYVYNG